MISRHILSKDSISKFFISNYLFQIIFSPDKLQILPKLLCYQCRCVKYINIHIDDIDKSTDRGIQMLGIFWPRVHVVWDKKFSAVSIEIVMHAVNLPEVHL